MSICKTRVNQQEGRSHDNQARLVGVKDNHVDLCLFCARKTRRRRMFEFFRKFNVAKNVGVVCTPKRLRQRNKNDRNDDSTTLVKISSQRITM